MAITPRSRHVATLISHVLAAACSSRAVPSAWPESAAASPASAAAPIAAVTRSLEADPPLPGESAAGWEGLESSVPAESHAGHEHGAIYTCPMHPEVLSEAPGKCPRCGMNLVKRDAEK